MTTTPEPTPAETERERAWKALDRLFDRAYIPASDDERLQIGRDLFAVRRAIEQAPEENARADERRKVRHWAAAVIRKRVEDMEKLTLPPLGLAEGFQYACHLLRLDTEEIAAEIARADAARDGSEEASEPWMLDPHCVERFPEAGQHDYHPSCCRFPKSCSAWEPPHPSHDGSEEGQA